jgi:hypothetical protein
MHPRFQNVELNPSKQHVLEGIEKHGWSVMNVQDSSGKPGWSYTIGLFETYGHPEVIICGMEVDNRQRILNWIGNNAQKKNPFIADQEHDWVLDGYKCWSKPVEKKWYSHLIGFARWFYGYDNDKFPCLQAIYPDNAGTYPWQEESSYSDEQPLLYETDLVKARMLHYLSDEELVKEEWPFACNPHTRVFVSRCVLGTDPSDSRRGYCLCRFSGSQPS